MSIAGVNQYLESQRASWAVQCVAPGSHVPAEMSRAAPENRGYAFSIIVANNKVTDALNALASEFGVDASEGLNRFIKRTDGNTCINLTFAEEHKISAKLMAPPNYGRLP